MVDRELLNDLAVHEGLGLLFEQLEFLIKAEEARVIVSDISKVSERELLLSHARLDGQRRLARAFKQSMLALREKLNVPRGTNRTAKAAR
jgi:hypothetical protein